MRRLWIFHPGAILKKYKHCPQCGKKLVKQKCTRVVTKDDEDFYEYYSDTRTHRGHLIGPVGDVEIKVSSTLYVCDACDKKYTFEQLKSAIKSQN